MPDTGSVRTRLQSQSRQDQRDGISEAAEMPKGAKEPTPAGAPAPAHGTQGVS